MDVTVAICTYNGADDVPDVLDHLRAQEQTDDIQWEVLVVDNNSNDRTEDIIKACGVRHIFCEEQGTPFAREAGLQAAYDDAEYLWMSDADVRVVPPIQCRDEVRTPSTIFQTSYEYLETHPNYAGVSSGGLVEDAHWSYRLIHQAALAAGVTQKYSCWAGYNQFVRKWALEASGGIDTTVLFGEDHHRHYQLARWAKDQDMEMGSPNTGEDSLIDPVYISGRRYATLGRVMSHMWETLTRDHVSYGEDWTEIEHKEELDWRHIR